MDFAGLPLHPMLVHFPIALFVSSLGLEIFSFIFKKDSLHRSALYLYILAALLSPLVVLTGLAEAEEMHLKHRVLDLHKFFALLTMSSSLISLPILWFVHKQNERSARFLFIFFAVMIVIFVTLAAYNGGRMVYEYGIGVKS